MLAIIKLLPPSAFRINKAKFVLAKYFSRTCDGDDEGKNEEASAVGSCCGCPKSGSTDNMYNTRKYRKALPGFSTCPVFPPVDDIPTDIFRCTTGECVGPQGKVGKDQMYKNPEYFSFHNMSFFDIDYSLRKYRNPTPVFERKP